MVASKVDTYESHSINNKLQHSIILLVVQIWKKI